MEKTSPSGETPRWLRRAQENSWEPEILISGIVLLALTQVPRLLDKLHYFLEERTSTFYFYTSFSDDFLISVLKISSYWLIAGLITHLVMRSVWVSFVGLSYVYPQGIEHEKLRFQPFFKRKMDALPSFQFAVEKLENICSSIYAISFLLVMVTLSACLYMVFIIFMAITLIFLLPKGIIDDSGLDNILMGITILLAIPYLLDFITLGWLKRIRPVTRIYAPIYTLMSFITFAHIYRGIYYGLVSNMNRALLRVSLLIFISMSAGFVVLLNNKGYPSSDLMSRDLGAFTYSGYYRDLDSDRYSTWAHIQSKTITNGVMELFLTHKIQYEEMIIETCDANLRLAGDTLDVKEDTERDLACMAAFYNLYVDDVRVYPTRFYMTELKETGQLGLVTWIGIDDMEAGQHFLEVKVNYPDNPEQTVAHIPFYKTGLK